MRSWRQGAVGCRYRHNWWYMMIYQELSSDAGSRYIYGQMSQMVREYKWILEQQFACGVWQFSPPWGHRSLCWIAREQALGQQRLRCCWRLWIFGQGMWNRDEYWHVSAHISWSCHVHNRMGYSRLEMAKNILKTIRIYDVAVVDSSWGDPDLPAGIAPGQGGPPQFPWCCDSGGGGGAANWSPWILRKSSSAFVSVYIYIYTYEHI